MDYHMRMYIDIMERHAQCAHRAAARHDAGAARLQDA
jgi:hypothetical protein